MQPTKTVPTVRLTAFSGRKYHGIKHNIPAPNRRKARKRKRGWALRNSWNELDANRNRTEHAHGQIVRPARHPECRKQVAVRHK